MPILQMRVLGPQRGSRLAKGIQIMSTDLTKLRFDSKVKAAGNNLYGKEKRRKQRGGARRRESRKERTKIRKRTERLGKKGEGREGGKEIYLNFFGLKVLGRWGNISCTI